MSKKNEDDQNEDDQYDSHFAMTEEEFLGNKPPSDLEKFLQLYKSIGIDLTPEEMATGDGNQEIVIRQGAHGDLVDGYYGFYSQIVFDKAGKFISQGAWE